MGRAPGERVGDRQAAGKEDWGRSKFGQWGRMRRLGPGLRFPSPPRRFLLPARSFRLLLRRLRQGADSRDLSGEKSIDHTITHSRAEV